jgi:HPt (histidine-containing phosphotransfer) domain-containing protein
LRIAAHTLKVALGAFGAPRLAHLAQQLEQSCRHQDHPGASELLAAFQQESQRLVEALSQFSGATAL